ncbi:MAG: methylmalonyl-CoA epimerase [Thermoleophilia bacterium]|nr:methylmalonyl-CoA epimerase [Thermoleophilia bacterium]
MVGIHHVAFAVADLDASLEYWTSTFGATLELRAVVAEQGVEAASLQWHAAAGTGPLPHGTLLELVAPHGDHSGVAKFLDRRGPGMHHVAWAVHDVAATLERLARAGARLIDEQPRIGLHGTPVAFVHPSATGGVLVELVEVPGA